ncbi:MAG: ATP-grasp domain-containing protein [Rubripirellula sp.]|jgi:predicted ATP-grasp superfamily ATP-dependent carboligase
MQPPATPNRPRNQGEISAGTVVLIGASIRSAAQSANRAGFRVLGIDHFGDIDTRQACQEFWILNEFVTNPEAIRRFQKFPHFVVGGLNSAQDFAGTLLPPPPTARTFPSKEAASDLVPPLRNPDFDRWNDPQWLEKLSKECGLNFPNSFDVRVPDAAPPQTWGKRWLIKTEKSCGGLGVRWHTPCPPLEPAHSGSESTWGHTGFPRPNLKASPEIVPQIENRKAIRQIFQQWVSGRPHGATLICNGEDCRLLGICRSLFTHLGDLPFVYRGSFGPVPIPHSLQQSLQQLGLKITLETGYRGLLNLDLVINRSGDTFVLEVNPRWSGSSELIERWMQDRKQTDSLFGVMFAACNGSRLPEFNSHPDGTSHSVGSPSAEGFQYLKRIVFARQPFQFSQDLIAFSTTPSNDSQYQSTFSDLPADGTWISKGEPICTLISKIPRGTAAQPFGWGKEKGPMHQHRTFLRRLFESAHS